MSTDPTSLIRMCTQPVRQLSVRPLVWLAVLSTTAILACKEDPLGVDGTGSLAILVVPLEQPARADISAPEKPNSEPAKQARPPSVSTPLAGDADTESTEDSVGRGESAQAAREAAAPPRRDIVRITVAGPVSRVETFTPAADGSVDATIADLPVGTYSVEVAGLDTDLGGQLISEWGKTAGVVVRENETTQATVPFGSFLPVIDPMLPAQTSAFSFDVSYSRVSTATGYLVEADTDGTFPAPTTFSTTDTIRVISVSIPGTVYVRVRAQNNDVGASEAKPSDPVSIDIVQDLNPTGADAATAPSLGVMRGANGTYSGYNIYPADDQDWLALDLTTDATLTVDVLTASLASPALERAAPSAGAAPSPLDPILEIYDPNLTVIASQQRPRRDHRRIASDGRAGEPRRHTLHPCHELRRGERWALRAADRRQCHAGGNCDGHAERGDHPSYRYRAIDRSDV